VAAKRPTVQPLRAGANGRLNDDDDDDESAVDRRPSDHSRLWATFGRITAT